MKKLAALILDSMKVVLMSDKFGKKGDLVVLTFINQRMKNKSMTEDLSRGIHQRTKRTFNQPLPGTRSDNSLIPFPSTGQAKLKQYR